jgi:hypothetical protein
MKLRLMILKLIEKEPTPCLPLNLDPVYVPGGLNFPIAPIVVLFHLELSF